MVVAGVACVTPAWGTVQCVLPTTHEAARPQHPVTASDLVRLRDFGDIGVDESEHAMAISPDGRDLVVQLRQGQPATNDYCTALVVLGVGGFLRGGTADDFPIQLYAAHGFAVMSVNRPPYPAVQDGPKPLVDYFRLNQKGWADRRSVQSSLETIVSQLAARGIIDPARVGVTGQSDGASAATFALIHSKLFAAAALSTCCEDPDMMAMLGEAFADRYAATGYPRAGQDAPGFWASSSLDLHADRPPVPILIQASDQEARLALRTYTILKDAHWPIEMYIFPGESHVKLQSAHRLAMYERSVAWFEKWLGVH